MADSVHSGMVAEHSVGSGGEYVSYGGSYSPDGAGDYVAYMYADIGAAGGYSS